MGLFDGLKPKPHQDENQLIAQQIIERRTKENLIEKFTKDFHSIDLDNQEEMYDYMICNVKDIFKTFSSSKELCDGLYIKNFLNAIYDVITQNPEFTFTPEEVFGFNDAAYLYLINCNYSKQTKDEIRESKDKLFIISHIIIPAEYDNLKIFENSFSSDFLNEIFIARNSSKKETINIRRVNFMVFTSLNPWQYEDLDIMDLYRNLFWDKIRELFLVSMFDVYDENENWYTHTIAEMDGWVTNCIIYLLNELPVSVIKDTIIKYSQQCLIKQARPTDVRCSLRALSTDYSKVKFVAEELYEAGYYII